MNGEVNGPVNCEIRFRGPGRFRRFRLLAMDEQRMDKKAGCLKRRVLCLTCRPGKSLQIAFELSTAGGMT
jgi:hypothetical protein